MLQLVDSKRLTTTTFCQFRQFTVFRWITPPADSGVRPSSVMTGLLTRQPPCEPSVDLVVKAVFLKPASPGQHVGGNGWPMEYS
jgi:hypothetical protein